MGLGQAQYDVVFHLVGGQSIPIVFAVRNIPAACHVLFATKETEPVARRIQRTLAGEAFEVVRVEAYEPVALLETFREALGRHAGERMAANLTGGTKIMALMLAQAADSAVAASGAAGVGVEPYYVETSPKPRRIAIRTAKTVFLASAVRTVAEYVSLNSDGSFKAGARMCAPAVAALARLVADHADLRKCLSAHAKPFSECLSSAGGAFDERAFDSELGALRKTLEAKARDVAVRAAFLKGLGAPRGGERKSDAARFLAGGWLEVLAFDGLVGVPGLHDVQRGARVRFPQNHAEQQELDVVFCGDHHLYVVECKSGNVRGEEIQKLSAIVALYGGSHGRGILFASKKRLGHDGVDYDNLKTRIAEQKNLMLVELPEGAPRDFLANAVRAWAPGAYVPPRR